MVGLRAVACIGAITDPLRKRPETAPTVTCGGAMAGAAAGAVVHPPRRSTNAASQGCVAATELPASSQWTWPALKPG